MAEIVASAVASEAVSRISSLVSGNRAASHQSAEDKAERLEMAVLKIQSVVAVSEDLQITHLPLRQWKAKLKRVAVEGDSLLHVHKKKILEHNGVVSTTGTSSISRYIIHAAKRFVPFRGGREEHELSDSTLQRFERLADGADSFFRLVVQSSSRPERSITSLASLTQSLLAGTSVEFSLGRPGSSDGDLVLLWPWRDPDAEDELQAYLVVAREDEVMWQRNVKMVIWFRLSEAANILAIAMSCLDLLPPQFGAARIAIMGLLHQTIASQSDQWRSNLSAKSMWCRHVMRNYLRECGPPHNPNLKCSNSGMAVEENAILEMMMPKVEEGFYDDQRQALVECKKEIWCPQSAMFCSVAPEIKQPLTLSKLMETSTAPINRRKRRKSNAMSK